MQRYRQYAVPDAPPIASVRVDAPSLKVASIADPNTGYDIRDRPTQYLSTSLAKGRSALRPLSDRPSAPTTPSFSETLINGRKALKSQSSPRTFTSDLSKSDPLTSLSNRMQRLAQLLQDQYDYLQALHNHLSPPDLTLPPAPSFGPIFAHPSSLPLSQREDRLTRHVTALETTLQQHWAYLVKLDRYLGGSDAGNAIRDASRPISLFFPIGSAEIRVSHLEALLTKLESDQREERAYLKQVDAYLRK